MRKSLLLLSTALAILVAHANAAAPETDVKEILRSWEKASPPVKNLEISFRRFHFTDAFGGVERRGTGRFLFQSPDNARYELRPAKIERDAVSRALNKYKKPFRLLPERSATRMWTVDHLASLDPADKTYRIHALASEERHIASQPQGLLPFITGVRAADLQREFKFQCLRKTEAEIYLRAAPRSKKTRAAFHHADILLNAETYGMKALQLTDRNGTNRTVYVFSNRKTGGDVSDDFSEQISSLSGYQLQRR